MFVYVSATMSGDEAQCDEWCELELVRSSRGYERKREKVLNKAYILIKKKTDAAIFLAI